ncbi:hypothetical protein [Amycolatopsis magusensis]|uniref:hypothetical protein n=1 Tax=Amycolatopsis magusensis TaxID=882444 RepID=UPI0037ADFF98
MTTLKPEGALQRRQFLARQTLDVAQDHLYEVLLGDVARIVRDALPTAIYLVLEVNDQNLYNQPPYRVGLLRIVGPGAPALWARDQEPGATLADYRTDEDIPWSTVVPHIEQLLTAAIGTEVGGMWWEPESEDGNTVFWCKLPTAADVAALQARQPRNLVAYLVEDDPRPWGALWFSPSTPRPTMAVAGVAITASLADDDVLTVEIDPTKTDPKMMRPAGPGTAVRVLLADTAVPAPSTRSGDDAAGDEEPEVAASEDRDGSPQDGDQNESAETEVPVGQPGTELVLASSTLSVSDAQQRVARPAPAPDFPVTAASQLENLLAWYAGDDEMRYGYTVEDDRHDNARRAGFAALAVFAYAHRVGAINAANDEDPETVISDLLGDLRHLADSLGLDFAELDRRGRGHYEPELYGEV